MQINREGLDKLLSMNDFQLKMIISKLAAQSGIDPAQFNIDPNSIESIRRVLSSATDSDLERIAEQYASNQRNKRG
jgi:hypothetical protein